MPYILSLNNVTFRLTKIMNNLLEQSQSSDFQSHFSVSKIGWIFPKKICEEYLIRRPIYINEIFWKLWFLKYFIYWKCAQFLSALIIILVSLRMTFFSEKILISNRCISGLMSYLIKKSWTVSSPYAFISISVQIFICVMGWPRGLQLCPAPL